MNGGRVGGHSQEPQEVIISPDASSDAFQRTRVSLPVTLFDHGFAYDLSPLQFEEIEANSGAVTHDANLVGAKLSLANSADSLAAVQSYRHIRYHPGKSQFIVMSFLPNGKESGAVKRVGYYGASDGIYFEINGLTDVAFVRRTSTGESSPERVTQSNWNVDRLDGTGRSGVTLDLTKSHILIIDLQWLGMGRVRVGFDIGGKILYVHEFIHANRIAYPYMKTASLPLRAEIRGQSGTAFMHLNCASVMSENSGSEHVGDATAFGRQSGVITAGNATDTHLISIRPRATFNSIVNRMEMVIRGVTALVSGNNPVIVSLLYNPSITGGSWVNHDTAYSGMDYNITAASFSGGVLVDQFFVGATSIQKGTETHGLTGRLPLTLDAAGANPKNLTVVAQAIGGTSTMYAALAWSEYR